MTEYINREDAIKMIENDLPEVVYYRKEDAIACLKCLPCADVAPKSESEFDSIPVEVAQVLKDKAVEKAKAEVAREIFEEIGREINDALKSNYKALPQFEQSDELWNRINGKIDALRGLDGFIAELKKKYTEG